MRVIFRAPDKKEIEVKGDRTVKQLAKELNFSLESHLVIRDGQMLTPDQLVKDEDVIEIFSAVSGG
ncbi:MoaD/ThiS family protein [Calderihabitans maritimus]|uniref:Sulfur carrier protein ThiS n=1 Tax=Calderihabitans maritimus TaxID=1246530 RepID=A0A1Z5HN18_9FIRM|nr:MoaD/ThiS family protein [Calderihabitans maritimus]GAW90916.1 sulfur carrier protein ThiS [Calderihabitans maritimus]